MNGLNMRNTRKAIVIEVLAIVMIWLPFVIRLNDFYGIYIIGDEFGYWNNAAWIFGWDWTDVAGNFNPYYSYGYSLFLIPLFWLKSSVAMYRAAIFLNALFLVATYALVKATIRLVYSDVEKNVEIVVACVTTVYTFNIFSALTTQSECCLVFFLWLLYYVTLSEVYAHKTIKCAMIAVVSAFIMTVHMRSVGVVIAVFLVMLVATVGKKVPVVEMILYVLVLGILLIVALKLKGIVQSNAYPESTLMAVNDIGGQTYKFTSLLSAKGLFDFVVSLIAKLWYIGCATMFVVWLGIIEGVTRLYRFVKDRDDHLDVYNVLLAALSFGSAYAIGALSMRGSDVRADLLVYGRYMEFAVGPVILLGLMKIVKGVKVIPYQLAVGITGLLNTYIVYKAHNHYGAPKMGYWNNASSIPVMAYVEGEFSRRDYIQRVFVFAIVVYLLVIFFNRWKKMRLYTVLVVGLLWMSLASIWSDDNIMANQTGRIQEYYRMSEVLNVEKSREVTYVLSSNEDDHILGLQADYIQFVQRNKKVHVLLCDADSVDRIGDLVDNAGYVVINNASNVYDDLVNQIDVVEKNETFTIGIVR